MSLLILRILKVSWVGGLYRPPFSHHAIKTVNEDIIRKTSEIKPEIIFANKKQNQLFYEF